MYIWQFQIGNNLTVYGRTWAEYIDFLQILKSYAGDNYWVVYVHNLAYEFQFLAGQYQFAPEEVFAVKNRTPLLCYMFDAFEYRCSYLLSRKKLDKWGKDLHVAHPKKSGDDLDYYAYRTSNSYLTDENLTYCFTDVICVVECVQTMLKNEGDTLYTIPLTATGYVRREAREAMRGASRSYVHELLPEKRVYELARQAFRGGETHASRYWTQGPEDDDVTIDNVKSVDRSSSYPDVVVNCRYPMTAFIPCAEPSVEKVKRFLNHDRAMLMVIQIWGIRLQERADPMPYLSIDKCRDVPKGDTRIIDNGRIIAAAYLETAITDIDLRIILNQYEWDNVEIKELWTAKYGYLPKPLRELVKKLYREKTELKGEDEYNYMMSKQKLNAGCFGMIAQDPCKAEIIFDGWEFDEGDCDIMQLLTAYYEKGFLPYTWAPWITAHARRELRELMSCIGMYDLIYVDTDSCKYVGNHDSAIAEYDTRHKARSEANGAYADDKKGVRHYMGVAEVDGVYSKFKTLGAKKYAYEVRGEEGTHITIAGVSKHIGGEELDGKYEDDYRRYYSYTMVWDDSAQMYVKQTLAQRESKRGLKSLREGYTFYSAGGAAMIYNDAPETTVWYNGQPLDVPRNCTIVDSTYTIGYGNEYRRLLTMVGVKRLKEVD